MNEEVQASAGTVQNIIWNNRKPCVKWVSRKLIGAYKE